MRGKKKQEDRQMQEEGAKGQAQSEAAAQAGTQRNRITPVDIQRKEFRPALRGYNERDVDAFLDEVTEEVARLHAENKRLREDIGAQGTTRLDTGAAGEAEGRLREAREKVEEKLREAEGKLREAQEKAEGKLREAQEKADRVLTEAEAKAAGAAAGPKPEAQDTFASSRNFINAFLARERDFLQSLAALIQGHAESVKEDIRVSRDQAKRASTASGPVPPAVKEGPGEAGATGERSSRTAGEAMDDRSTQQWRPAGSGPDRSAGPGAPGTTAAAGEPIPGAVATSTMAADAGAEVPDQPGDQSPEAVLDLTKVDPGSSPREDPASEGARPNGKENEEDDESTDRSLRELFWGED